MNADGSGAVNISEQPGLRRKFTKLVAGRAARSVFTSDRDANLEIYIMNADGSGQTNLTDDPDVDWRRELVYPDGTRIAFAQDRSRGELRHLPHGCPTAPIRSTSRPMPPWTSSYRAWSPDGEEDRLLQQPERGHRGVRRQSRRLGGVTEPHEYAGEQRDPGQSALGASEIPEPFGTTRSTRPSSSSVTR